eukprot:5728059-Pyramimonas_sp.AAC.1
MHGNNKEKVDKIVETKKKDKDYIQDPELPDDPEEIMYWTRIDTTLISDESLQQELAFQASVDVDEEGAKALAEADGALSGELSIAPFAAEPGKLKPPQKKKTEEERAAREAKKADVAAQKLAGEGPLERALAQQAECLEYSSQADKAA